MVVRIAGWAQWPWLRAGFSTRLGGVSTAYRAGDLNLGWTKEDADEAVAENRRRVVAELGGDVRMDLVTVRQVHGDMLWRVPSNDRPLMTAHGRAVLEGDGLMTDQPGLLLGAQAADCVPILLADTRLRVVAAVHAGWRGTQAGIAGKAVPALAREFGSRAQDLVAAVGPSIGPCCYAVGDELRAAFDSAFAYAESLFTERREERFLDLWEANRRQLADAGVPVANITVLHECTACARTGGERKYFSHRAEKGVTGRAMGLVGIALREND
jgi:YfiH family protein